VKKKTFTFLILNRNKQKFCLHMFRPILANIRRHSQHCRGVFMLFEHKLLLNSAKALPVVKGIENK
jgi:hypothetical protein